MPNSDIVEKIKSRGYWRINIYPEKFVEKQIPSTPKLFPIVLTCSVQLRGWDFPHIDTKKETEIQGDSIDSNTDWAHYVEYWRFYLSGQFLMLAGFAIDWRNQSPEWWGPIQSDPTDEKLLTVGEVIARTSETFEFASRLAKSISTERLVINISCHDLSNRCLITMPYDSQLGFFHHEHRCTEETFTKTIAVTPSDLASGARELAIPVAQELSNLFGWDPNVETIRRWQQHVLRR